MKCICLLLCCIVSSTLFSQTLQLHYDLRHTIDTKHNQKNYTTLYFEYFKNFDSVKSFVKPGSFLLKMQADFAGEKNNMSQAYMQVSQTVKFWRPNIFINLQYSGGLGVTEPKQYSYYLINTFSIGAAYPFKLGNAYMSSVLNLKHVSYQKPTNDFLYTLYWWKGLLNYKMEFAGDFSAWTENKNHGDDATKNFAGKRFSFFAEPQIWYNFHKPFSIGTKVNTYYHILTPSNVWQFYPTIAARCKL